MHPFPPFPSLTGEGGDVWKKQGAVDPCLCLLYMQPCEERHGALLAPNLKCCWTDEQMFDKCTPKDLQCFINLPNYPPEMIGKLKKFSCFWAKLDSFNMQVSCLKDGSHETMVKYVALYSESLSKPRHTLLMLVTPGRHVNNSIQTWSAEHDGESATWPQPSPSNPETNWASERTKRNRVHCPDTVSHCESHTAAQAVASSTSLTMG